MPTQIRQTDVPESRQTFLRVQGEMFRDDALLVEKIATGLSAESGFSIVIDLADLDFMDSEAASVLRRLEERDGFSISGVEIFLQSAVDMAERS